MSAHDLAEAMRSSRRMRRSGSFPELRDATEAAQQAHGYLQIVPDGVRLGVVIITW